MDQTQVTQGELEHCAKEPIHVPGSIQPHGFLLVITPDGKVQRASQNSAELLPLEAALPIGKTLREIFPPETASIIEGRARSMKPNEHTLRPIRLAAWTQDSRPYHLTVARGGDLLMLEFEPMQDNELYSNELDENILEMNASLLRSTTVAELCEKAAELMRELTGFERILIYRFDEDWNGEVLAEAGSFGEMPSYLHHRFPASDIPAQARRLYALNPIRIISDSSYTPVPIVPASDANSKSPLDLSWVALRSVSPVHLEYLRNMGVRASMSVSLMNEGKLWGLMACHHPRPVIMSPRIRSVCCYVAEVFGVKLRSLTAGADQERLIDARSRLRGLFNRDQDITPDLTGLVEGNTSLLDLVDAQGAALLFNGQVHKVGKVPSSDEIQRLANWLQGKVDAQGVFQTTSMASHEPHARVYADVASGVLAVPLKSDFSSVFFWFRPEVPKVIKWAGDPVKSFADNAGLRVSPRKSFQTYQETMRLTSESWAPVHVSIAEEFRTLFLDFVLRQYEEITRMQTLFQV